MAPVTRRAVLRGSVALGALGALAACGPSTDVGPDGGVGAGGGVGPGSGPGPSGGAGPSGAGSPAGPSDPAPAGSAAPESDPGGSTRPSLALGVPGPPAIELVRARTGRPEVALTFHGAGDRTLDRKILEALTGGGAAVTVLAVGTWLRDYPDAARMVVDLGHELGNHTWSHRTMSQLTATQQRTEIERCRDRLHALTGGPGAFFRQSAAQHATREQLELAGAAGYPRVLSYDVDSRDWTDPGPTAVRQRLRAVGAGSVVSMHLGHPGTLAAIPGILTDLRARGLRAVTATQLFA